MTANLTDRYVWAVLRSLPGAQRAELEPEIRALVADAIDAKARRRATPALVELGDPNALAARYADRPQYLIGPSRLPRLEAAGHDPRGRPRPDHRGGLVRCLADQPGRLRAGHRQRRRGRLHGRASTPCSGSPWSSRSSSAGPTSRASPVPSPWTPESLPDLPDAGRMGVGEMAGTVVANILLIAGLLWVQLQSPITIDGQTYPAVRSRPVVVLAAVLHRRRRRSRSRSRSCSGGMVDGPTASPSSTPCSVPRSRSRPSGCGRTTCCSTRPSSTRSGGEAPAEWLGITGMTTVIVIVSVVAWDAIDGFLKARRAERASTAIA